MNVIKTLLIYGVPQETARRAMTIDILSPATQLRDVLVSCLDRPPTFDGQSGRRRDRHSQGHKDGDNLYRASTASRGKTFLCFQPT